MKLTQAMTWNGWKRIFVAFFCFAIPLYLIGPILFLEDSPELMHAVLRLGGIVCIPGGLFAAYVFYKEPTVSKDDKLFWLIATMFTHGYLMPVIYFKTYHTAGGEKLILAKDEPRALSRATKVITGILSFAIPLYVLAWLFGDIDILDAIGVTNYQKYFLLSGFMYVLWVFWRLDSTSSDDKLFWTIAIICSGSLGLPLLYIKKIAKKLKKKDQVYG